MNKFIFILIILLSASSIKLVGQNYALGQEVNDTIMSYNYGTIDYCYPDPDISLQINSNLIPFATGLQVKIVIDDIIPDSGIIGTSNGIYLNIGDELLFNDTILSHPIYFFLASEIKFSYVVTGMPSVLGEHYYCSVDSLFTFANCNNWFEVYPDDNTPNCQITMTSNVEDKPLKRINVYPNPFRDFLKIDPVDSIQKIEVFDINGNMLLYKKGISNNQEIDFSNFGKGIYFIKIITIDSISIERVLKN